MPQQEPSEKELYEKFKARKSKRPTPPVGAEKQSQMYDPEFDIGGMPTTSPAPKVDWMAMPESKPMVGAPVGSDAVMSKRRAIADFARSVMPLESDDAPGGLLWDIFGNAQNARAMHRGDKLRQIVEQPEIASDLMTDADIWGGRIGGSEGAGGGIDKERGSGGSGPLDPATGMYKPGMRSISERRATLEKLVAELRAAMEADKGQTLPVGAATPEDIKMKEGEIEGLRKEEAKIGAEKTFGPSGAAKKVSSLSGIKESIEAIMGGLAKGKEAASRAGEVPGQPRPEPPPVVPKKEDLPQREPAAGIIDKSQPPQNASMLQDINKMFPEIQARDPGILEGIIAVLGGFLSGKPQTESIDRLLGKPEAAARNKQRSELYKSMIQQQGRAQSQDQSSRDRAMRIAIAQYGVEAKPILTKLFSITDEQEGLEASLMPPDRKSERRRVLEAQEAAIYKTLAEMQGKYGVVK